jgi:hypothetical protein
MKAYRGSRGIASFILDLGIRWRWVVNFTPRPLCPSNRSPVPIVYEASWLDPRAGLGVYGKEKI